MSGLNRVMVIGNVGRDPELRYTAGGKAVASFSIAVNESRTGPDGKKIELVTWFSITAWDRLAEIVSEYVKKGRQVYIDGKIVVQKWTDKQGQEKTRWEVSAANIVLLGSPRQEGEPEPERPRPAPQKRSAIQEKPADPDEGRAEFIEDDSDLPF